MILALPLVAALATAAAPPPEAVRCSFDEAPPVACTMTDSVDGDGSHRMTFAAGDKRATFIGKAQSGWWSGTLNGRPAMGYERNRGNMVFSTRDLGTRFAWWYPTDEHGNY